MITKENIKEILTYVGKKKVKKTIYKDGDFISLQVFVANAGFSARIKSMDYDDDVAAEHYASGQLFTDKDSFLILVKELDLGWDI